MKEYGNYISVALLPLLAILQPHRRNFFSPCLTGEHDDQRQEQAVENAGHNHAAENDSSHGLNLAAGNTDKPAKASLKEKLEAYKAQVAGMGNTGKDKTKGKEEVI